MTVTRDQISRHIFYGMRKHNFVQGFEKIPFDELPKDYRGQLDDMAEMIPKDNPMSIIVRLRKWCKGANNPVTVAVIDRFIEMEQTNEA